MQRHENQELSGSYQTLLRERMSLRLRSHIQTCKQEHSRSCQNFAQAAKESARPRHMIQRHAIQELMGSCQHCREQDHVYKIQTRKLLGSCQTLLRKRRVSKTTTQHPRTCKTRALWLFPNLAEPISRQDHVYTFKRANQEPSSSCQNLAQATDESARPRLHDTKCKSRALKLLPNLAQRADESARPRLHLSTMQTPGLAKPCTRSIRVSKATPTSYKMQIKSSQALVKAWHQMQRVRKTTFTLFKQQTKSS